MKYLCEIYAAIAVWGVVMKGLELIIECITGVRTVAEMSGLTEDRRLTYRGVGNKCLFVWSFCSN